MKRVLFACLISLFYTISYSQTDTSVYKATDSTLRLTVANTKTEEVGFNHEGSEKMYIINKGVDIPILVIGAGWCGYAFTKIYSKDPSTPAQIENLNRNDINSFNRSAIDHYSKSALDASMVPFYAVMPLPIVLLVDKSIRKDFGTVSFLYFESMSITGLTYTASVYFHNKYRPFAYNPNVPMSERTRGGAKNSFYAGHVALVATSAFFVSTVYSNYHPHSPLKWILYAASAGVTGLTGYLRYQAGQHFPSDILIGAAIGIITGIVIPNIHKNKALKNTHMSFSPIVGNGYGMAMLYRFN